MSQLERLTPSFREALRRAADGLAKGAQCRPEIGDKEGKVEEVCQKINKFNERIVRDWLYGLDDDAMGQVAQAFDDLNELSAVDFALVMRTHCHQTPFGCVAALFEPTRAEGVILDEGLPMAPSDEGGLG